MTLYVYFCIDYNMSIPKIWFPSITIKFITFTHFACCYC